MPQICDAKKNSRVIAILTLLDDGRPRKTSDLAAKFGVTNRSIQRDFAAIELLGYDLEFPKKGYVQFAEGVSMKKRPITPKQQQGLKIFKVFSKTLAPDLAKACLSLAKSFEESQKGPEIIPLMPQINSKEGDKYIEEIFEAAEFGHALKIKYFSAESKEKNYEIRPYALLYSEGFIYLLSALWDKPKEKRTYRLDRIKELEHLYDKTFSPPKDISSMVKSHNIWGVAPKKYTNIKLEIKDWAADYFRNFILFKDQKIKERKDGTIELEAKISKFEEVLPQIFRWIPCVRVISPYSLAWEVKSILEEYLKKSN
ncbi:MAG: transcriptional regulator [Elusimicrobia bacterium]|nr:transcriptional regulator [Elusimicrobiota bacterium]